jgi:hypothetical protein
MTKVTSFSVPYSTCERFSVNYLRAHLNSKFFKLECTYPHRLSWVDVLPIPYSRVDVYDSFRPVKRIAKRVD